jgi:hypothetical protein
MRQRRNLDMAVELQYEEFRGVVSDEDGPRDSSKIEAGKPPVVSSSGVNGHAV